MKIDIIQFLTDADYRAYYRRQRALDLIRQRHMAVSRHVYIETVFHYSDNAWEKTQHICVDGVRVLRDYKGLESQDEYFADLEKQYYIRNRHHLLGERV